MYTCPVCHISTVSSHSKKEAKKCSASSGHTTKLEQSISLDIYGYAMGTLLLCFLLWDRMLEPSMATDTTICSSLGRLYKPVLNQSFFYVCESTTALCLCTVIYNLQ
jgi:hypothetical protein